MNRANQLALFQATNQGLLGIRQSELNYYINLNVAFGTQAALIGGFTYGVFTQNQKNEDYDYSYIFQDIYWITTAGTIAASVHVIITTMLMQVLGPGLALHGPIGSMTRATVGMRNEQRQIITSFIVMMVLFSFSTVLSFWAVMTFESALGGTIVFLIAARYWYFYCERIYLRFYWEAEDSQWAEHDEPDPAANLEKNTSNPLHPNTTFDRRTSLNGKDSTKDNGSGDRKSRKLSRFLPFLSKKRQSFSSKKQGNRNSVETPDQRINSISTKPGLPTNLMIAMEGYLLKKSNKSDPWERFYFVLHSTAELFFYKNRQDYKANPKAPIYIRPLVLSDFYIVIYNSEKMDEIPDTVSHHGREYSTDGGESVYSEADTVYSKSGNRKSTKKKLCFQITLFPKENEADMDTVIRQQWLLRCDTEEELDLWAMTMQGISPSSFRD